MVATSEFVFRCNALVALSLLQQTLSVDLHMISAYTTSVVTKQYSVERQRAVLLGWAARFRAFAAGLPAVMQGAQSALDTNVFTAGALLQV